MTANMIQPDFIGVNNKVFVFSIMSTINFNNHVQFFTATIPDWKQLLKDDEYKQIIIDSLLFLKKEGSIIVYGFVITHFPGGCPHPTFFTHNLSCSE